MAAVSIPGVLLAHPESADGHAGLHSVVASEPRARNAIWMAPAPTVSDSGRSGGSRAHPVIPRRRAVLAAPPGATAYRGHDPPARLPGLRDPGTADREPPSRLAGLRDPGTSGGQRRRPRMVRARGGSRAGRGIALRVRDISPRSAGLVARGPELSGQQRRGLVTRGVVWSSVYQIIDVA